MLRRWLWPILLSVTSCAPEMVGGRTYLGFSLDITQAPPPPRVVFVESPRTVVVPGTDVEVVENAGYDMYQCDGYWYVTRAGFWYQSASPSGPFAVVDVRSVPRTVVEVKHRGWHGRSHGGPPGWSRRDHDDEGDRDQ